jgi:hypothetical protein
MLREEIFYFRPPRLLQWAPENTKYLVTTTNVGPGVA